MTASKESIRTRILDVLIENHHTTGDIAKKLGYVDANGHGEYKNIAADLKKLKKLGLIYGKKISRPGISGAKPTSYFINTELSALRKMAVLFPIRIKKMQSAWWILEHLKERHMGLVMAYIDDEKHSNLFTSPRIFTDEEMARNLKYCENGMGSLMGMSTSFFEICLYYDFDDFGDFIDKIAYIPGIATDREFYKASMLPRKIINVYHACVTADAVNSALEDVK